MNKASGGDGIPAELFQILKDDAVKVLHSVCQQIWKTQQWPQDWKNSVFIPIPEKGNAEGYSSYRTIVLISHASKVMLKILQARLQQYVNQELPDVQARFRKGRGARDQIANIHQIIKKAREFQKNICFIDYTKTFDCVDHNKLENSLRDGNNRPHFLPPEKPVCRSRSNSQNQTWNNGLIPNWERSICQGCILTPCLFNLYTEYIMQNAMLDETQTGIKVDNRNINSLRYADDTTLMAESKEELKSLLMKMKRRVN